MNPPAIDIDQHVRALMARTTPLRRLRMASGMFAAARALALAGRPTGATDERAYLFHRFYERDFSEPERNRIIEHLQQAKR